MRAHRPLLVAGAAALALGVTACGGDDTASEPASAPRTSGTTATAPPATAPAPRPAPAALAGLPAFTAGFERWDRLNNAPIPPDSPQAQRVGFDAHRGTKNVHISVGRRRAPYPDGTVIVKAAGEDPATPTLV